VNAVRLDGLDAAIVHALHVDGRAPFWRIARVPGVSDQTLARRYRRLRSAGSLRGVGLPDARRLGWVQWVIRVQAAPGAAVPIAEALARRPDTSWVSLTSGGTEIVCVTLVRSGAQRDALLLDKLPRTPRIAQVTAHCLLRVFAGGPTGWHGRAEALGRDQVAALTSPVAPPPPYGAPAVLDEGDERMLAVLAVDGRAGYPELAGATGWSESTVRRRLEHLHRSGALFFDVDIDPALLGFATFAMLWVTVEPPRLRAIARTVATHPEVAFAAATTGPTNLLVFVACRDVDGLYDYLEGGIGALEGVRALESAPVIRSAKRAGAALPG
jgi:DNA-binding Lrp family transcriptional regulator